MPYSLYVDLIYIVVFIIVGILFAIGLILLSLLIAPQSKGRKTLNIYECGMDPIGPAWIQFGIDYYIYALIFLAFAVDVLFLFPVAIAYSYNFNGREVIELVLFVIILSLAIVYAWGKGMFKWKRKI